MGIHVSECEPDVDVQCDGCKKQIDSVVFCADCAGRKETHTKEQCGQCREMFYRIEMFTKIGKGRICHGCAFKHEFELLRPERRRARKKAKA